MREAFEGVGACRPLPPWRLCLHPLLVSRYAPDPSEAGVKG